MMFLYFFSHCQKFPFNVILSEKVNGIFKGWLEENCGSFCFDEKEK